MKKKRNTFFILLIIFLPLLSWSQVRVIENGDVGVKKDIPEHELDVEGVTRTSEYFEGTLANVAVSPEFQRIMFPEGASLFYDQAGGGGGAVGAIKIVLPVDWSSTMMKFKVEVFNYRVNQSFSLEIAGYPYAGGGGRWTQTSATLVGGKEHMQIPVRFAHDGNKPCVIIGNTDSQWAYLNVAISDLYVRLLNTVITDWTKGWDIEAITSMPTNIDKEYFLSSAYSTLVNMSEVPTGRETSKFYFWLNNHAANSGLTIGKLHLPGHTTFSFDVTVSGYFGSITYQFSGYSTAISKNIIKANPKLPGTLIDEIVDVDIQYNTNPHEAVIQIVNNSQTTINYIENVIIESYAQLIPPFFTPLDNNTAITPFNYQVDQNSARGKWKNSSNQSINDLDQTISRNGDVFIDNVAKGVIVRDQADGNCYRITTTNGTLSAQQVTCPQ